MKKSHYQIELYVTIAYHLPAVISLFIQDFYHFLVWYLLTIIPMAIFQLGHAHQMWNKFSADTWLRKHLKSYFKYSIIFLCGLPLAFLTNNEYLIILYIFILPELLIFYLLWMTYKASSSMVE
jgi:uncharacterized membrane protein